MNDMKNRINCHCQGKSLRFVIRIFSLFVIMTCCPSASQAAGRKQIQSNDPISGQYESERSNTSGKLWKKPNNRFDFVLSSMGCSFGLPNAKGRLSGTLSGSDGKFDDGRGCVVTFAFSKNVMNISVGAGCKSYCEEEGGLDGKWRRFSLNPNAKISDAEMSD
jgi:hypothetical protein